ncbi:MAG: helix-turn-helix transcriptional regulator [Fibrobacterales bacterium]
MLSALYLEQCPVAVAKLCNGSVIESNDLYKEYCDINEREGGTALEPYLIAVSQSKRTVRTQSHRFMIAPNLHVSLTFLKSSESEYYIIFQDVSEQNILEGELQNLEGAISELTQHYDKDKKQIREKIISSVSLMIVPYIHKLKEHIADEGGKTLVDVLEHSVSSLFDGFTVNTVKYLSQLSTKEMQICSLLKLGQSNKDMALELQTSVKTVETHRKNIRKKLNINNRSVNLTSYLQSLNVD